jgi:hypothetical protein
MSRATNSTSVAISLTGLLRVGMSETSVRDLPELSTTVMEDEWKSCSGIQRVNLPSSLIGTESPGFVRFAIDVLPLGSRGF